MKELINKGDNKEFIKSSDYKGDKKEKRR